MSEAGIEELDQKINEAKTQTPVSQADGDAANQKYDDFVAAVPW